MLLSNVFFMFQVWKASTAKGALLSRITQDNNGPPYLLEALT